MATGIPLIDGPLWLLGLELGDGPFLWEGGPRHGQQEFAIRLDDPEARVQLERLMMQGIEKATRLCLNCGQTEATTQNRFGERVCQRCANKEEASVWLERGRRETTR